MNVQQLIDELILVEDKTLPVCIPNYYGYEHNPHDEVESFDLLKGREYINSNKGHILKGSILLIGN